jgi:hypothetical protein
MFPNNAPGAPGLVAPSSDLELAALRRRCARAIWGVVPKGVGILYFGGAAPAPSSSGASRPSAAISSASAGKQTTTVPARTGTATASSPRSGPQSLTDDNPTITAADIDNHRNSGISGKRGAQVAATTDPAAALSEEVDADPSAGNKAQETVEDEAARHASHDDDPTDPDEERILSEIETGILDLFSDAYCNKHFMYGVLELVLVRLMPELAHKGIIELWEERLS